MKIKSKIQPLVFCFLSTDKLLEAMEEAESQVISLSFYKCRYYLTVHCGFKKRFEILEKLCRLGSFKGIGAVLDSFLGEHGVRICSNIRARKYTKAN